jgi:hypothetical protein
MMNGHGKSDSRVVPTKPPNNGTAPPSQAGPQPTEVVEGRRLAHIPLQSVGGSLRLPLIQNGA